MTLFILALFSFYTQYSYSGDIFQIFQSPFVVSLGEDHAVLADSMHPLLLNPAQCSKIKQLSVSHYTYHGGFLNVENVYMGGIRGNRYNFSFFFSYVHSNPVELTELVDTTEGPVQNNIRIKERERYTLLYMSTQASYVVKNNARAGVSMTVFKEKLPDYPVNGFGIDAGITGRENERIYWGVAFKNLLGAKIENGSTEILKPRVHAGVSVKFSKFSYVFTLVGEYDGPKSYALFSSKNVSLYAAFGFNLPISKHVELRAGTGRRGITMGAGLIFKKLLIDYAIVPLQEIGFTHKLSLTYNFE